MMPVIVFAFFAKVLLASSSRMAPAEAPKNADVLVTGAFAASGWLLSTYLDNVNKRFDALSAQLNSVTQSRR